MVFRGQSEGKSIFAAFGWGKFWGEQQAAVALVAAACIFQMTFEQSCRCRYAPSEDGDHTPLFRSADDGA